MLQLIKATETKERKILQVPESVSESDYVPFSRKEITDISRRDKGLDSEWVNHVRDGLVEASFGSFQEFNVLFDKSSGVLQRRFKAETPSYEWVVALAQVNSKFQEYHIHKFRHIFSKNWDLKKDFPFGKYFGLTYLDSKERLCFIAAGKISRDQYGRANPTAIHLIFDQQKAKLFRQFVEQIKTDPDAVLKAVLYDIFGLNNSSEGSNRRLRSVTERIAIELQETIEIT